MSVRTWPSRPTLFTLFLGALWLIGRLIDSFDRAHTVDVWLAANKDNLYGHLGAQALDNAWVFLLLGLVLWWHDNEERRDLKTESTVEAKKQVTRSRRWQSMQWPAPEQFPGRTRLAVPRRVRLCKSSRSLQATFRRFHGVA